MRKVNTAFKKRKSMKYFEVKFHDESKEPSINRLIFRAYTEHEIYHLMKTKWKKEDFSIKEFTEIFPYDKYDNHLTVGELKQCIEKLPDDFPVVYQRIEDFYFHNNGWTIIPIYNSLQAPSYDEYVRAFTAFVDVDKKYLCITAHY